MNPETFYTQKFEFKLPTKVYLNRTAGWYSTWVRANLLPAIEPCKFKVLFLHVPLHVELAAFSLHSFISLLGSKFRCIRHQGDWSSSCHWAPFVRYLPSSVGKDDQLGRTLHQTWPPTSSGFYKAVAKLCVSVNCSPGQPWRHSGVERMRDTRP